jgi:hypothetical protein
LGLYDAQGFIQVTTETIYGLVKISEDRLSVSSDRLAISSNGKGTCGGYKVHFSSQEKNVMLKFESSYAVEPFKIADGELSVESSGCCTFGGSVRIYHHPWGSFQGEFQCPAYNSSSFNGTTSMVHFRGSNVGAFSARTTMAFFMNPNIQVWQLELVPRKKLGCPTLTSGYMIHNGKVIPTTSHFIHQYRVRTDQESGYALPGAMEYVSREEDITTTFTVDSGIKRRWGLLKMVPWIFRGLVRLALGNPWGFAWWSTEGTLKVTVDGKEKTQTGSAYQEGNWFSQTLAALLNCYFQSFSLEKSKLPLNVMNAVGLKRFLDLGLAINPK